MKRKLLYLIIITLSNFVFYGQVLDQSNTITENIITSSHVANNLKDVGQSFVAGITGNLSQISLFYKSSSAPLEQYKLIIYKGLGYTNGDNIIGEQEFNLSSAEGESELAIVLDNHVEVIAGNNYTIKLTCVTSSGEIAFLGMPDAYENGTVYAFFSGTQNPGWDLWFKTYVNPTLDVSEVSLKTIVISPNPTMNVVTVSLKKEEHTHLQIIDAMGRVIKSTVLNKLLNHVDITDLSTGIYAFKMTSPQGEITKHIIKK